MNGWRCLGILGGLSFSLFLTQAHADPRPNVVIILADDLGYADVGYRGSPDMKTPHIDSLANHGIQFSAGYVTAPVCAPSRAGLQSGLYQNRFGAEDNPGPYKLSKDVRIGIPATVNTLAKRMKSLGYRTGMIGKSHAGNALEFHPNASGYDEFFGFINGASNYRADGHWGTKINEPAHPLLRNHEKVEETEYLTDAFGREAVAFIERWKDQPFFLEVPFNAIHGPMQATDEDLARFSHIKDPHRRCAVSMAYRLDLNVGRILDALRKNNLETNTIVFFLSDNGGKFDDNGSLNAPLRGTKNQLWEGGIRVPFCLQWPAQVKAGRTIDIPVITLDILPTVIAAAGGVVTDRVDGVDLGPLLTGKVNTLPDRNLYWRFNELWAVRDSEWKLVNPRKGAKPQLFHIVTDSRESEDVSGKHPDVVQRMQDAYSAWTSGMMSKLWGWDTSFPVYDPGMGRE